MTSRHGKISVRLLAAAALIGMCAGTVRAQYYSERDFAPMVARYIYAGAMHREFRPRPSNTSPDSLKIQFSGWMPAIGFHQGMVDIAFGYQRYTLRGQTQSSVFFGTTVSTEVPLTRGPERTLTVPVMLAADYTRADGGAAERDNFNIASVGLGAGLSLRFTTGAIDWALTGGQVLQYAIEGFSTGTGFAATTTGEASITARDFGPFEGIIAGYRFRYQTWAMSNAHFNYAATAHGPFLGILF